MELCFFPVYGEMMSEPDKPDVKFVPDVLHTYDVFRMRVRFEDDPSRSRNHYIAAVMIHADGESGVAVKLTSNPKWNDPGDVQLVDYAKAGLTHITIARCGQLVRFSRSDLHGFTGTLSREDAVRIVNALGQVPPESQVWL